MVEIVLNCDFCDEEAALYPAIRLLTHDGGETFEAFEVEVCDQCRREFRTDTEKQTGLPMIQAPLDEEPG